MAKRRLNFDSMEVPTVQDNLQKAHSNPSGKRSRHPMGEAIQETLDARGDMLEKARKRIQELEEQLSSQGDTTALQRQIDDLKAFEEEVKGSPDGYLISVDTSKIKWVLYNREPKAYEDEAYQDLLASISAEGQKIPAQIAELNEPDSEYDYLLIAGHRRYRVCKELGLPLWAIVVPVTDTHEIYASRFIENSLREGLSTCEKANFFQDMIDNGLASRPSEVASMLNISRQAVSRVMKYFELPKEVIECFPDPRELSNRNIDLLYKHIQNNGADKMIRVAKSLPDGLSTNQILARLSNTGDSAFQPSFSPTRKSLGSYEAVIKDTKSGPVIELPKDMPRDEALKLFSKFIDHVNGDVD